jgi:hypothetical protein
MQKSFPFCVVKPFFKKIKSKIYDVLKLSSPLLSLTLKMADSFKKNAKNLSLAEFRISPSLSNHTLHLP